MLLSRRDLPDAAAAFPLENVSLLSDAFMIFSSMMDLRNLIMTVLVSLVCFCGKGDLLRLLDLWDPRFHGN